jgi:class 3 adenylate cyclase/CHASE2 domain-containing sensor protein
LCCSGFFVLIHGLKLFLTKWIPVLIAGGVISTVFFFQALPSLLPQFDIFQRLEWMSYDWRVRQAAKFPAPVATNLAAVFMSDDSITTISEGTLGFRYGLYWPRSVYGRLVRELAREGVKTVGFDVMFSEERLDHPRLQLPDGSVIGSDAFFAREIRHASNVVLAAEQSAMPIDLFRTNAWATGDISVKRDADGILRQVRAYVDYRLWHPALQKAARLNQIDLSQTQTIPAGLRLVSNEGTYQDIILEVSRDGLFDAKQFLEKVLGEEYPADQPVRVKAFSSLRLWNMGIVLAARELEIDLRKAEVDLDRGRILFTGKGGLRRTLPIDGQGRFYIDWSLPVGDPALAVDSIENLLARDILWEQGETNAPPRKFQGRLVLVGSTATGADLTDKVTTPLEKDTVGVSHHWNVANSFLAGRFIRPSSYFTESLLILLMGITAAILTWELRALWAAVWVVLLAALYVAVNLWLFVRYRYWLPMILPLVGAMLSTHVCLVTYRVVFEQQERRRIKSVFVKLVSPDVVNEVLKSERLALGGARRQVSVYFADVRGFTELTDVSHARAEAHVRSQKLEGPAAEAYFDQQAQEVLQTVNLYLGTIADVVKKHNGTLDKYIGDCVMAFWGAPTPNEHHALDCVRAAVEAQRAAYDLNQQRFAENKRREKENAERAAAGLPALPLLSLLSLGTGINTGVVMVGLMGSDAHILNYTVFGREVNLASRLEGVSGRGRIIISQSTYADIQQDDPALAATCVALPPVNVKGIHEAVKIYEVPWKLA